MAERSAVFMSTQIGSESVFGTAVAASKRLLSVSFGMSPNPDITRRRASGYKFQTLASLNREWTELSIDGGLTYTEIVYPLSSILNKPTPSGTTAKTWAFAPSSTAADTIASYTIEQGDATLGRRVAGAIVSELTLSFSRSDITVSGSMIGGSMESPHTMTATPTEIALVPVNGPEVAVYLSDTYAGLDTADPLERPISVEWSLTNRFAPAWYLNQQTGFTQYVETAADLTVSLEMASDAEGLGPLPGMRTGDTTYLRIEAVGPVIGAGPDTYLLQIDTAVKVVDIGDFSEVEGVEAIQWEFEGFHDSTMGNAVEVTVVNEIAAL